MSSLATYQYQPAYHDEGKPVNQATQTSNTSRSDGRQRNDFREPVLQLGVNSQAAGSVYIELGRTKLLCTVYGPRGSSRPGSEFSQRGTIECNFKFSPFCQVARKEGREQEPEENEGSMLVRQALEPSIQLDILEKSVVDINVLVLEDDGCYLCAGIIAASLALCDAGIPMFDLVSCCSVAALSDDSSTNNSASLFLDPSEAEMGKSWCISTIAMMPLRGKVTFACFLGPCPPLTWHRACKWRCMGVRQCTNE